MYNSEKYASECERVASILSSNGVQINAVISLSEDLVPFKVLLQDKLNLKFNSRMTYAESIFNRNILQIYQKIANEPTGFGYVEQVETILDTTTKLIEITSNSKTYWPKCLKVSTNNRAFDSVHIVKNGQELLQNVTRLNFDLEKQLVEYKLFVTRYYSGTKHCLNLIMNDGQCLFSALTNDEDLYEQEVLQLENSVVHKLRILRKTHGVFSFDIVRTLLGMIIVKINPCIKENAWVKESTGINLLKAELILNLPMIYVCQRI